MRQGLDPLRVTLVDDSMLFRKGLAALLTDAGVEIAGVAATPDEAMVRIEADRPERRRYGHPDGADVHE